MTPESRTTSREQRKLIAALRRKDPRAIDQLMGAFGPLLRGYLRESLGDAGAAEDVLQQTLVDVWRRGPTFDPARASLSSWLLMIARSRAIDHLRRRVPEPYDPESLAEVADPDAESETEGLAERWRVAGLIAGLPRDEGRMLAMRFYEGLTQTEIAQRTGIPLGTVKMRMVQALERLRERLDAEEGAGT